MTVFGLKTILLSLMICYLIGWNVNAQSLRPKQPQGYIYGPRSQGLKFPNKRRELEESFYDEPSKEYLQPKDDFSFSIPGQVHETGNLKSDKQFKTQNPFQTSSHRFSHLDQF